LKLSEIVDMTAGLNTTRLTLEQKENMYSVMDLQNDLEQADGVITLKPDGSEPDYILKTGDFVISLIRGQAAIVSSRNTGRYINANFIKCKFDHSQLDPWYLCYLLNDSSEVSQQRTMLQQNSFSGLYRITAALIGQLDLNLPDIDRQKQAGRIYKSMLRTKYLMDQQSEQIRQITLQFIRRMDPEGEKDNGK